jgi:hypothetical protein
MKALHVKNIEPPDAIYIPETSDSLSTSGLQAGIAFTQVKKGWMGYIGDVNFESEPILFAMLGI